jgi:hypothetical protein
MSINKRNASNITEAYIALNIALNLTLNRFGYGAKGNELEKSGLAPREWFFFHSYHPLI